MKKIILLLLLASLAFAQQTDIPAQCKKGCCDQYNGIWDGTTCSGVSNGESYSVCVQTCEQVASGKLPCCGSAFVLLLIPALLISSQRLRLT